MPGHLERRADNSWTIVIDLGRDPLTKKRNRFYRAFRGTKKEAEKELARLLTEIEKGLFVEPSKLTVGEYLQKWLADAKNKVAPKTYLRYEEIVMKSMIPELGQIHIEKLKPLHIQNYYNKMLESGRQDGTGGLSPTTVVQHHRILHKALEMAVKWQVLARNVSDAVEPPRKARQEFEVLNEEQVWTMLMAAENTSYLPQLALAVLTGMRRGEIYGLRWRDVDYENCTITVSQAAQYIPGKGITNKEPKSGRSRRNIDVSSYVIEILKKVKVDQNKCRLAYGEHYHDSGDLVFTQPDGQPQHPYSISSWFPEFMEKTGLPKIRLHDLRHTHASLLLKGGESLKLICDRLGHGSIGITADIYTHLAPGMQKKAADRLEERIFAAKNGRRLGDKNEKSPSG